MKTSIAGKKRKASAQQNGVKPLTQAQNKLIEDHIPYAKNIAKMYAGDDCPSSITLQELETESCSALCEAALRFDPTKGADFKTYAYDWCKKFILAYIDKWGCIGYEDIENVPDVIPDDDYSEALTEERALLAEALLKVLNKQELKVVRLLFGFEGESRDFAEIAVMMHIQVARVHQIYEKARTKMEMAAAPLH